jgi:hypothetical protein
VQRIPAFLLLLALSLTWSLVAKAQIFTGPDSARRAQKAADKQQKAYNKSARKQLKASNKAARKQQKAIKKNEKQQRKAAAMAPHRT